MDAPTTGEVAVEAGAVVPPHATHPIIATTGMTTVRRDFRTRQFYVMPGLFLLSRRMRCCTVNVRFAARA